MVKSSQKSNGISSKLRTSYKKRKDGMKKKARELATLCGVEACVVFLGPEGELDSWPENPYDVRSVFEKYVEYEKKKRDVMRELSDDGGVMINPIESSGQSLIGSCNVECFSTDGLEILLRDVDKKLEEVSYQIEFVNSVNGNHNEGVQDQPKTTLPSYSCSSEMAKCESVVEDDKFLEDPIDLSHLQLPGFDVFGGWDDLDGQVQDISSWLNIDDELPDHDDFHGLQIPMDDLSDFNMKF